MYSNHGGVWLTMNIISILLVAPHTATTTIADSQALNNAHSITADDGSDPNYYFQFCTKNSTHIHMYTHTSEYMHLIIDISILL